jgi:hypothetical protein
MKDKLSSSSILKLIVSALCRQYNIKFESKETTEGACKAWLELPKNLTQKNLLQTARRIAILDEWKTPTEKYDFEFEVYSVNNSIQIIAQKEDGHLFIAVPRKSRVGNEYAMGVDC